MSILSMIGYIAGLIGFIATIAAAVVVTKSTTTKTTIDNQKELIATLLLGKDEQKNEIADLQSKHIESTKAIAGLQGQVEVLRNIPLKEISSDMKSIATEMKTLASNQESILQLISKGRSVTSS